MSRLPRQQGDTVPLVSVVIPTCNRWDVLERCLLALVHQTYPNYEVIVVDDASTDETPQFADAFAAEHPELSLVFLRNETHAGANPSRNHGIRAAKGEFVAFEDSDCIAAPDWIEKLVTGFSSDRVAAVTGLVEDLPPANVFELAFKGTHRLGKAGPARRLIAGNMCVRRALLSRFLLDEDRASQPVDAGGRVDVTVSGRGDEEGLFLMLRAAGYQQFVVPDAVVLHEHRYTGRALFRQAYRGGQSAARLVYKYSLPARIDMLPFTLTYATLPLMIVHRWFAIMPACFGAAALAAITYNDLCRKGKTLGETVRSFPVLVAYYHVRLAGYVLESCALRLGRRDIEPTPLRGLRGEAPAQNR